MKTIAFIGALTLVSLCQDESDRKDESLREAFKATSELESYTFEARFEARSGGDLGEMEQPPVTGEFHRKEGLILQIGTDLAIVKQGTKGATKRGEDGKWEPLLVGGPEPIAVERALGWFAEPHKELGRLSKYLGEIRQPERRDEKAPDQVFESWLSKEGAKKMFPFKAMLGWIGDARLQAKASFTLQDGRVTGYRIDTWIRGAEFSSVVSKIVTLSKLDETTPSFSDEAKKALDSKKRGAPAKPEKKDEEKAPPSDER